MSESSWAPATGEVVVVTAAYPLGASSRSDVDELTGLVTVVMRISTNAPWPVETPDGPFAIGELRPATVEEEAAWRLGA